MRPQSTWICTLISLLVSPVRAQIPGEVLTGVVGNATVAGGALGPNVDGKYTIYGTNIRADFVPYGAGISNLYINDSYGIERDIVAGWDNATYYTLDKQHPHFGGVPGRYANRIKNSTFELDGKTYHILPNENPTMANPDGVDTLHGGPDGWDWRNWTVVAHTENSISFSLSDPAGKEGFPGDVLSFVTYTLGNMTWEFRMNAVSLTEKTPIMLSSHTYWNLDGFANNETSTALNHTLWMPYAGQRIDTDPILIPTGDIITNAKGSLNDFWSAPKQIGANFSNPDLLGNCGFNCTGYDTCYINSLLPSSAGPSPSSDWQTTPLPHARISSAWSGISVDVYSDQAALQIYSCGGQNGSVALKRTQGTDGERFIQKYGCFVLEVEDYIGAINYPEWGRGDRQVFGPEDGMYEVRAKYVFGVA